MKGQQLAEASPARMQLAAELSEAHIDGALVIEEGAVVYANVAATKLFDCSREELEGSSVAPLLALEPDELEAWLRRRIGEAYEEPLRRSTGEGFAARVGVVELDRERRRFGLSIQDVSEARAIADALEAELVALEYRRAAALESKQALIDALSLPMLRIWEGVIAIPLIGPLEESRAADALERLLSAVVAASIRHVIIDLTGLESVDTVSAGYLARMIRTLALVGSRCVIVGIQPALAQVFVTEQLPLADARCFATQAEALAAVLRVMGWSIERGSRG